MRLVDRPHFGGLGNGDHPRLHVVLIANAVAGVADRFDREFAVAGGNGNQFAAGEFFRRAAFVSVDMSCFGANNSLIRVGQSFQAKAIGRSPVEDHKDFNIRAELPLEFADRRLRPVVVPVADSMALIGFGNRLQHFGMNSGIVVAGKAAGRQPFHVPNNVADGADLRPQTSDFVVAGDSPRSCSKLSGRSLRSDAGFPAMARQWCYLPGTTVILAGLAHTTRFAPWHSFY